MTNSQEEIHAPDYIEPIYGYRVWSLVDGQLFSPYRGTVWDEKPLSASCNNGFHSAPSSDCKCGIYAQHEIKDMVAFAASPREILGKIQAWGNIEIHEQGFRAEHAQIVNFYHPVDRGQNRQLHALNEQFEAAHFRVIRLHREQQIQMINQEIQDFFDRSEIPAYNLGL